MNGKGFVQLKFRMRSSQSKTELADFDWVRVAAHCFVPQMVAAVPESPATSTNALP
jgi:hypothetical protein